MKHQSQRGIALVLTLIMLSVITFLTVAFLAVSRRDRVSVTSALNQTDSHLMADTALERFRVELVSGMIARNDLRTYDLMQSRNYFNTNGFDPALGLNLTNVNYDYRAAVAGGGSLAGNDPIFNIANLYFDPRPPVFIPTNGPTGIRSNDFRFYLDSNRNARFEPTGFLPIVVDDGSPTGTTNGTGFANFLGEPEYIGVLQNPERPHSPTNKFIGRYLYFALPIGKTLDWNYIHNYAKGNIGLAANMPPNSDGFLRNQGFGSWEINLAAFLVDLNTNIYVNNAIVPYTYFPDVSAGTTANAGDAFNDAFSFLGYRYARNFTYPNLSSALSLFGIAGQTYFQNDLIDGYTTRPVLTAPFMNVIDPDVPPVAPRDLTTQPWSGSRNVTNFLEPQELFDSNNRIFTAAPNFATRLQTVSSNNNSYDRYTFSRLLEQIGMGSEPEVLGKININYTNNPAVNTVATNFVEWTPIQFFTNVADRLFKENLTFQVVPGGTNWYMFNTNNQVNLVHAGFSYTNIQIYPTNEYTAQLHRLLQVAANIYDATTTNIYPTVFRPQVYMRGGLTLIENFVAETNSSFLSILTNTPIQDPNNVSNPDGLVWGVPVVVGAKKGFPNFNKFVMQTSVQISRNLQIKKTDYRIDPPVLTQTNQQLYLGVSNRVALEAWNSYASTYNKSLRVIATNFTSISLTNQSGGSVIWPTGGAPRVSGTNISQNLLSWPSVLAGSNAYYLPIATNSVNFISDFQVTANGGSFTNSKVYQTGTFPIPAWNLVITNRLLYVLIDTSEPFGRVIDFVNISDLTNTIDVAQSLIGDDLNSRYADQGAPARFMAKLWDTNRIDGTTNITVPTKGVDYQISVSREDPKLGSDMWDSLNPSKPTGPQREEAVDNFLKFMEGTGAAIYNSKNQTIPPVNSMQTPFNPALKFDNTVVWAINDPLVHYMSADLKNTTNLIQPRFHPTDPAPTMYLRQLSERYRPWGGNRPPFSSGQKAGEITDESAYDFTIKDPRVRWSDDWDFPTNKFPSIGWLGRVHRGTPWQTIYLKAGINEKWFKWAGNFESHPTNDWKLADIFTASANDNAARGLLSINQTNKAAWSAVLSGIIGLRNILSDVDVKKIELFPNTFTNLFETPAPVLQPNSPELLKILEDVNRTRQTGFGGVYQSLGQILAVPSLSVGYTNHFVTNGTVITTNQVISASPFLNVENDPNNPRLREAQRYYGVTDEAVERIPRQIMSLLKLGEPRFVVYCYGQSLKPANNSLVLNAPANSGLFNLCTNYQITGEIVTRTLLRVEASPDAQHPKTVIESYNILQE